MSERVLNFSEFFTKYSKEGQVDQASLDNLTGAAANFEEGFDKDTYDQAPLGPKKPIASSTEATPPQPGEVGAPAFNAETEEDMIAPDETAPAEAAPVEAEEPVEEPEGDAEEAAEEPAEESTEGDESTEEKEETDETPEPEAGANPKKKEEKVEEGLVVGFASFINEEHEDWEEEFDDFEHEGDDNYHEEHEDDDLLGANPFDEDDDFGHEEEEYEYCDQCGEPIYHTVEGASCGCNM